MKLALWLLAVFAAVYVAIGAAFNAVLRAEDEDFAARGESY